MIVVVLIGIIMAITLPAGRDLILQSRLTTQANALVSDILYARNEAATQGLSMVICPSTNATNCSLAAADWSVNRFIFVDTDGDGNKNGAENNLKLASALPKSMTLVPSGFDSTTRIRFNSTGGIVPLGSSGSFKLCATDAAMGRQISIGINGRPSTSKVACP